MRNILVKLHKYIDKNLPVGSFRMDLVDVIFSPLYGFRVFKLEFNNFNRRHVHKSLRVKL